MTTPTLSWNDGRLCLQGAVTHGNLSPLYKQASQLVADVDTARDVVVLDCSHLSEQDSAALALLLEIERQLVGRGKKLTITGSNDKLISLIHLYGLEWLLAAQ